MLCDRRRAIASHPRRYLFPAQMLTHFATFSLTGFSARNKWTLTVPSLKPMAPAISNKSISSTKRKRNTVRWRSGTLAEAFAGPESD